jgi:hypothetical protein
MNGNETEFVLGSEETPPPDRHDTRTGETKYPFDVLQVNHTFKCRKSLSAVRQAILRYHERNENCEKRFTARQIEGGWVKVWRTK